MKNLLLIMIASLGLTLNVFGQRDETLFSGIKLTGGWGGTELNLTSFAKDNALYRGGYGGIELNKSIFLGWGGFDLENDVQLDAFDNKQFDMSYNGFMMGYTPRANRVFHPNFMLLLGSGKIDIEDIGRDKVFVVQPSAGVEINIFRWFRLGLDGGYRFVTDTDIMPYNDNDLSAFYGALKFKFGWSWGR